MREYIFRGKRKDNGEWIYGYLLKIDNSENKIYIMPNFASVVYYYEVDPETVGQYTGLKDKNGVKIYEGDIFEVMNSYEERFLVWVEYSEKYAQFVIRCNNCIIDSEPLGDVDTEKTVILLGNIYDNPGLLERKEEI